MDVKGCLALCKPIKFYDVCTIYPIEIETYIECENINDILFPYIISKDMLVNELKDYSIFEILLSNKEYLENLYMSLVILCRTENITFNYEDKNNPKLFFDDNKTPLDKNNFDEFANIILLSSAREKYKPEPIPVFETPEGYERWKQYEDAKNKYKKKEDNSLANIINIVQFGNKFYIDEDTIKKWSMWKLINSYNSILNRDGYEKQYSQYLVTGKPDNIKEHWSELLKVK